MTPQELQALRQSTVTTIELASHALSIGRTLGYQLARERGELAEGVRVLRVGRKLVVPTRPLLAVLGYGEADE
ncbi:MAG TPA: DNA-binding protein [Thermoleophilia bacterium]|nr:DNA-binding protein [Thermoleophilia bacterium]